MRNIAPDRFEAARTVADAVLYEGYVLYPYRASARKNQIRWQFGVLTPRSYADSHDNERWSARTEVLARTGEGARLSVRVRFLQTQRRSVERACGAGEFETVDRLRFGEVLHISWSEALDRAVDLRDMDLAGLEGGVCEQRFFVEGDRSTEVLSGPDGSVAGRIVRSTEPVEGAIFVGVTPAGGGGGVRRISVTVENRSEVNRMEAASRADAVDNSLVALHVMLGLDGGKFLSALGLPDDAEVPGAACSNEGMYPVLIGDDDVVLSSPIILYDHPEVAPESPGDLYDATEIDEILALRVLTLTDDEKAEARRTDPRSAAVIDRCDEMPPESWSRLHGAMRELRPVPEDPAELSDDASGAVDTAKPWWDPSVDSSVDPFTDSLFISGTEVAKGSVVKLRPSRRADVQDVFLRGRTATVAGVFKDVEGNDHVAVLVDDDPANEELAWQGRFLYFYPDELEPVQGCVRR